MEGICSFKAKVGNNIKINLLTIPYWEWYNITEVYMVMIEDDVFEELLWDRIREFYPCKGYSDEFWEDAIEFLRGTGFSNDKPQHNSPKYIIDNIAVNSDSRDEEQLKQDGLLEENETIDDYDGEEGIRCGEYIVFNFGI